MRYLLLAGTSVLALAACGGGGTTPGLLPPPARSASASIVFSVPLAAEQVGSIGRAAGYVAGGGATFTFSEDGVVAFAGTALQAGSYADPRTGATATIAPGTSSAQLTVTVAVGARSGKHDLGIAVSKADGTVMLSANERGVTLVPGSALTLPLAGDVATGYIACATSDQIRRGDDCAGYANFDRTTDTYTFTAVAADAAGYPFVQGLAGDAPVRFANGPYEVVESPSDVPRLVTIAGGPWSAPGAVLSGASGSYGNPFTVQCVHTGVAHLILRLSGPGTILPLDAQAGSVAVNCTASGALTII
jgi:hypothetical protein